MLITKEMQEMFATLQLPPLPQGITDPTDPPADKRVLSPLGRETCPYRPENVSQLTIAEPETSNEQGRVDDCVDTQDPQTQEGSTFSFVDACVIVAGVALTATLVVVSAPVVAVAAAAAATVCYTYNAVDSYQTAKELGKVNEGAYKRENIWLSCVLAAGAGALITTAPIVSLIGVGLSTLMPGEKPLLDRVTSSLNGGFKTCLTQVFKSKITYFFLILLFVWYKLTSGRRPGQVLIPTASSGVTSTGKRGLMRKIFFLRG